MLKKGGGKKGEGEIPVQLQLERGVRTCESNSLQPPRSVQKEGREVPQALEQKFRCSPWSRPW